MEESFFYFVIDVFGASEEKVIHIMCLKLVSCLVKNLKSTNAIETDASSPNSGKVAEGLERYVASRATTDNSNPITVDVTFVNEVSCNTCSVLDITDSPFSIQSITICSSITTRANIVHLDECVSARGPVLDHQREPGSRQ